VRENARLFIAAGLLLAGALALLVSPFASSSPDGLNRVAIDKGFDNRATDHALDGSPVANYAVRGVDDGFGRGLSGLIGVLLTFGIGLAFFAALRSFRSSRGSTPADGRP
jgi:PDGLE domain